MGGPDSTKALAKVQPKAPTERRGRLYETVFLTEYPKEARSVGLPRSYVFRHGVKQYGFLASLQATIERKFSAPQPGSDIVRVVWWSNDKHPCSSTIQLHVLPWAADLRKFPVPFVYRLHSTTHEGAAKEYGLKQVD
jgi:hypothetical protein